MEIKLSIPQKLERYIEGFNEETISKSLVILLELAIKNELFSYPESILEKNVKDIFSQLKSIKKSHDIYSATSIKNLELILNEVLDIRNTQSLILSKINNPIVQETIAEDLVIDESNLTLEKIESSIEEEDISEEELLAKLMNGIMDT